MTSFRGYTAALRHNLPAQSKLVPLWQWPRNHYAVMCSVSMVALLHCGSLAHAEAREPVAVGANQSLYDTHSDEKPSIGLVVVDAEGRLFVSGRAGPGGRVTLANGNRRLGATPVDEFGSWQMTLPYRPAVQDLRLTAVMHLAGGGAPLRGDVVSVRLPELRGREITVFDVARRHGHGIAALASSSTTDYPAVQVEPAKVLGGWEEGRRRPASRYNMVDRIGEALGTEDVELAIALRTQALTERLARSNVRVGPHAARQDGYGSASGKGYLQFAQSGQVVQGSGGGTGPQPAGGPANSDRSFKSSSESPFDWFYRISEGVNRSYNEVLKRIASDTAVPAAGPRPADARVTQPKSAPVAATPPSPPAPSGEGTVSEWISRANRDYQAVVRRISGSVDAPTTDGKPLPQPGDAVPIAGAATAAKVAAEQAAAETAAAQKAAVEKAAAEAKRAADMRAAAEKAAADKAAAEAKRIADEQAAAAKAAAERAAAETRRQAEEREAAERAVAEKAALEKAATESAEREAQRLAEARVAADQAAAEAKRQAEERAERERAAVEAVAAEQKRLQEAEQAVAEAKRIADQRAEADKAAVERAAEDKLAADQAAADRAVAARALAQAQRFTELRGLADRAAADYERAKVAAERSELQLERLSSAFAAAEAELAAGDESLRQARALLAGATTAAARRQAEGLLAERQRVMDGRARATDVARMAVENQRQVVEQAKDAAERAVDAKRLADAAIERVGLAQNEADRRRKEIQLADAAKLAREAAERAEAALVAAEAVRAAQEAALRRATASKATPEPVIVAAAQTAAGGASASGRRHIVRAKRQRPASATSCPQSGVRIRAPGWYVVKPGDTLSHIALWHYGRASLYPRIYRANRSRVADPDLIFVCQRLWLPAVQASVRRR